MKRILAISLALVLAFCMVACGKSGTKYIGKEADYAGHKQTLEEMGVKDTYIEIYEDNKCDFSFNGKKIEGTYTLEDTVFVILSSNGDYFGTLDGNDIVLSYSDEGSSQDMILYFTKQ